MIRLYSFYSVGGYKDLYIGHLSAESNPSYYLPLLTIMKKRGLSEEVSRIAELDKLDKIQIITKNKTFDFPNECKSLFSHGGYTIMYRTLSNGLVCLAIRNLYCSMKDEEGRSTPFTLLFVAENQTDIRRLDNVATYCLSHSNELNDILSPTIVYDAVVNGLRADLSKIYSWISSCQESEQFIHIPGIIDYVMVSTASSFPIVLKEHNIDSNFVNAVALQSGQICKGKLQYVKTEVETSNVDVNTIIEKDSNSSLEIEEYKIHLKDNNDIILELSNQKQEKIINEDFTQKNQKENPNRDILDVSCELEQISKTDDNTNESKELINSSNSFVINEEVENLTKKSDFIEEKNEFTDVHINTGIQTIETKEQTTPIHSDYATMKRKFNENVKKCTAFISTRFLVVRNQKTKNETDKKENVQILFVEIPVDKLPLLFVTCLFIGLIIGLIIGKSL